MTVNLPTVLICALLLAVIGGIIWGMIRSKKKGKSSCGCGCASCALNGTCHPEKKTEE